MACLCDSCLDLHGGKLSKNAKKVFEVISLAPAPLTKKAVGEKSGLSSMLTLFAISELKGALLVTEKKVMTATVVSLSENGEGLKVLLMKKKQNQKEEIVNG